jgi:hypothetical protein
VDWGQKAFAATVLKRLQRHCEKNDEKAVKMAYGAVFIQNLVFSYSRVDS